MLLNVQSSSYDSIRSTRQWREFKATQRQQKGMCQILFSKPIKGHTLKRTKIRRVIIYKCWNYGKISCVLKAL